VACRTRNLEAGRTPPLWSPSNLSGLRGRRPSCARTPVRHTLEGTRRAFSALALRKKAAAAMRLTHVSVCAAREQAWRATRRHLWRARRWRRARAGRCLVRVLLGEACQPAARSAPVWSTTWQAAVRCVCVEPWISLCHALDRCCVWLEDQTK
jgi:hypothetical protein